MSYIVKQNLAPIPLVIGLLLAGQSNFAGTTARLTTAHGVPLNTSADGGAASSLAMLLAEMIAFRRGHTVLTSYAAYGGTSIKQYAGYCDGPWQAARSLYAGVTVTNVGYVYSLYGGDNTKISNSFTTGSAGNAPVGTTIGANETTGDTLVWKCLGTVTARDVQGTVYNKDDVAGKFDPLGRMLATTFNFMAANESSIDRFILATEWGEQDAPDVTMTTARFRDSDIAVIDGHFARTSKPIFAAPGLAPYYAAQDANYPKLTQAVIDVVAYYAALGDARVKAGSNLRTDLGVLPTNPGTAIKGLKADAIHMNEYTIWLAAEAWYARLLAAGFI